MLFNDPTSTLLTPSGSHCDSEELCQFAAGCVKEANFSWINGFESEINKHFKRRPSRWESNL